MVGDDPGSQAYVAGKPGLGRRRDPLVASGPAERHQCCCARRGAPGSERRSRMHRLHRCSCRCRKHLDEGHALEMIDPPRTPMVATVNLGRLVPGSRRRCPGNPRNRGTPAPSRVAHREVPRGVASSGGGDSRPPPRAPADPTQRERHRDPVPHRDARHGRTRAPPTSSWRRRVSRDVDGRHGEAGGGGAGRRHHPHRVWWAMVGNRTCLRWPPGGPHMLGGLGPMTRAMLLANIVDAAEGAAHE